jgi:hypothetical protein
MAEPVLDSPRVVARIRQGVAAGAPRHVGVNRKGEAGALADALDQPIDGVGCERAAALGGDDEGRVRRLPSTARSSVLSVSAARRAAQPTFRPRKPAPTP